MQDSSDRFKRRRVEYDELPLAQERMFQMAAGADASNADVTSLLLRQRLMAAEQQQETGLASSLALRAGDTSLLAGGDPLIARMRQNLLNQRLQQAARLQAVDDMSYLRASDAAGASSLYAASLLAPSRPLSNSLLLEQALGNENTSSMRASAIGPEQLRALQMQSLLEAEREEAAAAAAAENGGGSIRSLLGLTAAENGSQAALLARRFQNERAMVAAGMGAGPYGSAGLQSLITCAPARTSMPVTPSEATLNRDILFSRGVGATPSSHYLGLSSAVPGTGGAATLQNDKKRPAPQANPNTTGRPPIHLFMSCDMDDLSPYQCLVRKQIELFEAQEVDAETNARGRNRPIVVGQVGIRCKHCKMLPPRKRERAAIYYPSKLDRLYQAGQTMASVHLGQHCNHIPEHLRQELARLREGKSAALAGKKYWSDGARALGVIEEDDRLFFKRD